MNDANGAISYFLHGVPLIILCDRKQPPARRGLRPGFRLGEPPAQREGAYSYRENGLGITFTLRRQLTSEYHIASAARQQQYSLAP